MDELQPTPPECCGLAIALPASLADVEAALAGGPYRDYVSRGAALGDASKLWNAGMGKIAGAIESLAAHGRSRGVHVVVGARAEDVAELFASRRVVTVVAHWRGPEITVRDLLGDPLDIARGIAGDTSEVGGLLQAALPRDLARIIEALPDDRMRRSRLAEIVDGRMWGMPALAPPPPGSEWHMDPHTLRHFNRACLDERWPDVFVAGSRLELADGLHSPEDVSRLVPEDWHGVADLSSCQSAQLIDEIKQGRADRVVVANELETNPLLRMAVLQVVYEMLEAGPRNYADVRRHVAASLGSHHAASR